MPGIPGEAIIGGVTGLLQTGIGIAQKIKAAKMAKRNIRPDLEDSKYLDDAFKLNSAYADEGLSANSLQAYTTNNDRNLSSSLDAMLRLGGGPNLVSELYDNSTNALQGLALADDQARVRNRAMFVGSLKEKASEERDKFFLNKYQPWADKNALINEMSKDGMNNIWKGINTIGGAAASAINPYKTGGGAGGGAAAGNLVGGSIATDDLSKFYTPMKLQKLSLGKLATVPPAGGNSDNMMEFDPSNIFDY